MSCRLAKSQDWATRLAHEASLHDANSFLTLTFSDEHLPSDMSVRKRDLQLFMKRLRKALGRGPGEVRYFGAGEYGDRLHRPHYHLILFGYDFPDKVPWRKTPSGFVTYRSAQLERLWPYGHSEIGQVTKQSAGYVARYCLKKATGDLAAERYTRWSPYGFPWSVCPEFVLMSTKPGLGADWYEEFKDDCFPSDFVIQDGRKVPLPRYYMRRFALPNLDADDCLQLTPAERVKLKRKERASKHADNNTDSRLLVRDESQQLRAARLRRSMDDEQ